MICSECRSELYCLDSRYVRRGEITVQHYIKHQIRMRYYGCANCDNRFIGTEVLNPQPYTRKKMPRSRRKLLFGEGE